jgi:uncharacterized protein
MSERKQTALITGASSGIGTAFAHVFASHGYDLVMTARREARLQAIADRLTRQHNVRVHVIPCDLATRGAALTLCTQIQDRDIVIDALVNSAGFGVPGGYARPEWCVHEQMLQTMVVAVSELTYRLLPGMVERRYGRIVNVASTAGLVDSGAGTMYGAAKAFVVRFSVSLSREVSKHGVYVTAICPGPTATEFHRAPGMAETIKGMPGWMWMDPLTVANQGFAAVMAGKPVYVNGLVNRMMVALFRYVPHSIVSKLGRQVARMHRRMEEVFRLAGRPR